FLYYATRDTLFHFRGRRVSPTEHILHLAIGITLFIAVSQAVAGNSGVMLSGLLLFVVAGGIDEYVWHRDIPEAESDLYAKEHLALLIFVVATLAVNWLDSHNWRLFEEHPAATGGPVQPPEAIAASTFAGVSSRPPLWRTVLLPVFLLPYAYFGLSDNLQHYRHRRIPWAERIVHATIVLALLTVVPHALNGNCPVVIAGLVLFLMARSFDEWSFHRNLAGRESDLHAKTHFAFLAFVVLLMTVDWLTDQSLA
ncbi:MAG TPA: hypothetical protein VGH74_19630, partial [Planctomycetaceae bacterium]